jgi:hypothetical protein
MQEIPHSIKFHESTFFICGQAEYAFSNSEVQLFLKGTNHLNIHLQNQVNAQVTNIHKSMVLHDSHMFGHICAILSQLVHQT